MAITIWRNIPVEKSKLYDSGFDGTEDDFQVDYTEYFDEKGDLINREILNA